MEVTVSPQGGDGCSSNENQSRLERQLEWSRRIGIDDLKRIYGASLFLKCMADLFHLLALLALCIGAAPVFLYSAFPYTLARLGFTPVLLDANPETELYPLWILLCIGLLISAQYLKRLKMSSWCRKTITMFQIGLAAAAGYSFYVQVMDIVSGTGIWYIREQICQIFIVFFLLYLMLKANCAMLGHSRSGQARIFAVVLSLVWGTAGLAAMIILTAAAAVWVLLMAGILWIAAFSGIRHQLFRDDALSHQQLYAVLKQKQLNVPDDDLVIQEDSSDISRKKIWQGLAWFSLAYQLFTFAYFFLFLLALYYSQIGLH